MEWQQQFSTGVDHLDNQHRMLFRMEGDFTLALEEGRGEQVYDEFLRSLEMYSRIHFGAEEECMFRLHCPAGAANLEGHQVFRGLLDDSSAALRTRGFRRQDAVALAASVRNWLVTHIGRIDTQLRPLVEGK